MLLLKTWRDILARKGQFFALIILVALAVASYVTFITSYRNLKVSMDLANSQLKLADIEIKVQGAPPAAIRRLEGIKGVRLVQGRFVTDTVLHLNDKEKAVARMIGIPAERHPPADDIMMLSGRYLDPRVKEGVLLHTKFAAETGLGPRDTLILNSANGKRKVKILGIVTGPEFFYPMRSKGDIPTPKALAVVYMAENDIEEFFGKPRTVNDFIFLLEPGARTGRIIHEAEDILEPYTVLESTRQKDQPSNYYLHEEIRGNQSLAETMPVVILVIAILALSITMSRLVQSQRGEIGLSKALGYSDAQVLVHYLLFSLLIGVFGSLIGFALGQYLGSATTQMYVDLLHIPLKTNVIHPDAVIGAVVIALITCIASGLFPALRSARMHPAVAMHSDPNLAIKGGRIPLVEKLLGWMLPRSLTFRMPLRNAMRARRRSIYTIIGIVFALILTVSTYSMFDSVDYLMKNQLVVENWDASAFFAAPVGDGKLHEMASWDGVNTVQGALVVPAKLRNSGRMKETGLTITSPKSDFHGFSIIEGDKAQTALAGDGLILPSTLADTLKVGAGDKVSVKTPYMKEYEKFRVAAVSDEMWGQAAFAGKETAGDLAGPARSSYNTAYLRFRPAVRAAVRQELFDMPGVASAMIMADFMDYMNSMLEFTYVFAWVLFGFGGLMAFVVIYNTFTNNIIERTREMATMMTIGETKARLLAMITMENFYLALIAIPLGLWAGWRSAQALFVSWSSEAFSMKAYIYPKSYVLITVSIIVILLLSEIPPFRRVFKMNLAEATKVME